MTSPVANKYPDDTNFERQLVELNAALETLYQVFPNVLPEVFREILLRFDGDSRVEVAVNQLVKYEHLWVKGRWRPQIESIGTRDPVDVTKLSKKDSFRCNSYKVAVKAALLQEFKSLSKSAIKAVLAEQNHSYTSARPILQGIASRNWRHSINKFFSRWSRRSDDEVEKHPFIRWTTSTNGIRIPTLRKSGDDELDHELDQFILTPLSARCKVQQEARDWDVALRTNQDEARNANAFFECECCFSETTFEQITTCSSSSTHILCFRCVLRAASEALYGQSWKRGIHHDQGLLRCIAPTGNLEHGFRFYVAHLARTPKSQIFISFLAHSGTMLRQTTRFVLSFVLEFGTTPTPATVIKQSLSRLTQTSQFPTRFQCRAPACSILTCTTCFKPWRDPHTCCDSAAVELRTTVEAARTEALKRTCPKCGLSFIKDSGCNKLTCVCGYTMCYVCRQGLGLEEGGQGYSHFCQHFRYAGGGGCAECEKCDLYRDEDQDEVVKAAGLEAERRWRKKQAFKRRSQGDDAENQEENDSVEMAGDDGAKWSVQGLVDWRQERLRSSK
ncbi:MAG: hypothetical protein Q9212_004071 [Teloschistes hypoglaucus]